MFPVIEKTVEIAAAPAQVWDVLTRPEHIVRWLAEPEVGATVQTSWEVGSPIVIRGHLYEPFEVRGTVLRVEPPTRLVYSHLSSLSRLPDLPENYAELDFQLSPLSDAPSRTRLVLTIRGCATESIYRHLNFYFGPTLAVLKRRVEAGG